jgi:ATP-dependent DNA helicase RecG
MSASISLETPVAELYRQIAQMGPTNAHKLASGLAEIGHKRSDQITVDDLLHYLPMRYEDRSRLARIRDLEDGMETSLELYVKLAGGYQVRNKRAFNQRLFIFEVAATDQDRTGQDVVVWTFLSGPHAQQIITNYARRFARGDDCCL